MFKYQYLLWIFFIVATSCAKKNENKFGDQMPQNEEFQAGSNYVDFQANEVYPETMNNPFDARYFRSGVSIKVEKPVSEFEVQKGILHFYDSIHSMPAGITTKKSPAEVMIPIKNVGSQGYCWIGALNIREKINGTVGTRKNRFAVIGSFGFHANGSNSCLAKEETGYILLQLNVPSNVDVNQIEFVIETISYDQRKYYQPDVAIKATAINNVNFEGGVMKGFDVDFKYKKLKNDAYERDLVLWSHKNVHSTNLGDSNYAKQAPIIIFFAGDTPIRSYSVYEKNEDGWIDMTSASTKTLSTPPVTEEGDQTFILFTNQPITKIRVYSPFNYGNYKAFEDE